MKTIVILMLMISAAVCFGQTKPKVPSNAASKAQTAVAKEISGAEWKVLTDAVKAEDWTKSAAVTADYLQRLKTDNDKKQLAQLRYLRMFVIAGKILAVSDAKVPADTDALWKELDDAASEFNGSEFVLPLHNFSNECRGRVNYICRVADNNHALRVTAANEEGTAIHSFDYVIFDQSVPPSDLPEVSLFLGGTLKRVEYNQDSTKPWVMRLIFDKGFVSVIASNNK